MSLGTWAELVIVTGDGPGKQPEYSGIGSIHYSRRAEGNGTWILHCRQGQSQFLRGLSAIVTVKIKKKFKWLWYMVSMATKGDLEILESPGFFRKHTEEKEFAAYKHPL